VLARPDEVWLESVVLNAGSSRGVSPGDLVVNDDGVVGVVSEKIQAGMCWVTLATSPNFRLAARTGGSACEGVIAGLNQRTLKLMYISAGSPVKVNEKVFSSEVTGDPDGSLRPRGLLVGTVKHVAEDVNGFLTIEVAPAIDPNKVSNVLIYTQRQ
jgi:rod shape-determining protein MreC